MAAASRRRSDSSHDSNASACWMARPSSRSWPRPGSSDGGAPVAADEQVDVHGGADGQRDRDRVAVEDGRGAERPPDLRQAPPQRPEGVVRLGEEQRGELAARRRPFAQQQERQQRPALAAAVAVAGRAVDLDAGPAEQLDDSADGGTALPPARSRSRRAAWHRRPGPCEHASGHAAGTRRPRASAPSSRSSSRACSRGPSASRGGCARDRTPAGGRPRCRPGPPAPRRRPARTAPRPRTWPRAGGVRRRCPGRRCGGRPRRARGPLDGGRACRRGDGQRQAAEVGPARGPPLPPAREGRRRRRRRSARLSFSIGRPWRPRPRAAIRASIVARARYSLIGSMVVLLLLCRVVVLVAAGRRAPVRAPPASRRALGQAPSATA